MFFLRKISKKNIGLFTFKNQCSQLTYKKVYRPWGWYKLIEIGNDFQVKKLQINSKAKLSLQEHEKRNEHWVVVTGEAKVTLADKVFVMNKNQSVYIPKNTKHRLENCNEDILEVIEVQTGDSFDENDIVRYEDIYGRE